MILKDKTFGNHDAAMRHTVENLAACRALGAVTPIMIHVHDGASDYNMTLGGAMLAHLAEYVMSGADMTISMRFCPYQSYNDPAGPCRPPSIPYLPMYTPLPAHDDTPTCMHHADHLLCMI